MDKELFYKNQVLKYLVKGDKDKEPSEIESCLDELGEDKVFKLFKKYNLKDQNYYLDKFKDLDLSNNVEEFICTSSSLDESSFQTRPSLKESTTTHLEELCTYVFILLNNKEMLRVKEVAIYIFRYTIDTFGEKDGTDTDMFQFIDFYQDLTLTYLEKEAIESGYQEYLIEEGNDFEIFNYLFFYNPLIFTKLLDTLMNDKKDILKNVLKDLEDFDLETYEDNDWYLYLLDTSEDLDFLFDTMLKNPSGSGLNVYERAMKLIRSKKENIPQEKLKIYKYKTDLFINTVLKNQKKDLYSIIFKIALIAFEDEMSYLISEYYFNTFDQIYSFIRFNAASDDVFNAFIKPSHYVLLNVKSNVLFGNILSYKNDIIYLLEALFNNANIVDPIFLKGCKEFRRRSKTSLDTLYQVLLKSVIDALTTAGPTSNHHIANFVYNIYKATDGKFDMRDDLIDAFPTRKAFHRDLKLVFPIRDYFY